MSFSGTQKTVQFFIFTIIVSSSVRATWWFISQLPLHAISTRVLCDNIPGLVGRQKRLRRRHPDVMLSLGEGVRLGIEECQHQFKNQRWNCPTMDKDTSVFGKIMRKGSREASFVHGISSAGVVHAITRACGNNKLKNCACDPRKTGRGHDKNGPFDWGGCSDNIRFGQKFSRVFVDAKDKRVRDVRALVNLHNNRAGRRAVKKLMRKRCKCHGVSGSCSMRTCWKAMLPFRRVGSYIKKRYNGATNVMMNQEGTGLIVTRRNHKRPTRSDLVYCSSSPDYCDSNSHEGSVGTSGRQCKPSSPGTEGCDIMCCGRGYDTKTVKQTEKCNCKFNWCCSVNCQDCMKLVDLHSCKNNQAV